MRNERVAVVAPLPVLGNDQLGAEAADLADDVAPKVEAGGQVAVGIAKVDDLPHAQDVGRGTLLGDARGGQLLRRDRGVLRALAAISGDDVGDFTPRAMSAAIAGAALNSASSGWLKITSARSSGSSSSSRSRSVIGPYRVRLIDRRRGGSAYCPAVCPDPMRTCRQSTSATHTPRTGSELLNRLRRIEGQARGLQRLVDEEAYCLDLLQQVRGAHGGCRPGRRCCCWRTTSRAASAHAIASGQGKPYVGRGDDGRAPHHGPSAASPGLPEARSR